MNPKINNMYKGYLAAKYEYILISDSNILINKDVLEDMVQLMTPDVGLVHQMPFCNERNGWSNTYEKVVHNITIITFKCGFIFEYAKILKVLKTLFPPNCAIIRLQTL